MAQVQRLLIEEDGEIYEIYVESKEDVTLPSSDVTRGSDRESYGFQDDAAVRMQEARRMIRGYTSYVLSAFRDFAAAEVEEVNLTFGLKLGGSAGIPYITQGKAESNLEISVRCTFPKPPSDSSSTSSSTQ